MQKEYQSNVPSKPTKASAVYEARQAYHEATDSNWSVLGAFKAWLERTLALGFWCKFCGGNLEWKRVAPYSPFSFCPECESDS